MHPARAEPAAAAAAAAAPLLGSTHAEMCDALAAAGVSPAHALTLFRALFQDLDPDPAACGTLPGPLRRWLAARPPQPGDAAPQVLAESASADGWTRKFLLGLADGRRIESVLMGFPGRHTACLSTQAGCAMGCTFCATGGMGFERHLEPAEIAGQAVHLARLVRDRGGGRLRNLVLMGMGEPLHNFDAVIQALEIITDTRGLNIGAKRITISTVGHVPGILRLARHPRRFQLAVSLHAASDAERTPLVPVTRRWPLADLLGACREYTRLTGERVLMAWTLIDRCNDSDDHARRLAALLRGMNVQVNLIPLNPTDNSPARPPLPARVAAFQRILLAAGLPATIRQRRGIDVAAGCGQLRARTIPEPA
jgi:23S rRNA (adenine2503-C2)-methyltransferase